MPAGRPPKGPRIVEGLEGSRDAKRRLRIILETISGARSVPLACEELGIGEAMFHKLRSRTLQEAVEGLEPRPLGRPPTPEPEGLSVRVSELEGELERVRLELEAAELRHELSVHLPSLSRRGEKKGAEFS